jgi:transposase-like protein
VILLKRKKRGKMDKNKLECPACESKKINKKLYCRSGKLNSSEEFLFKEILYRCDKCGFEADFFNESEKYYKQAKRRAENMLVKKLIKTLHDQGISNTAFERVFEIEFGSLDQWMKGYFSSSDLALLRIITKNPELIFKESDFIEYEK